MISEPLVLSTRTPPGSVVWPKGARFGLRTSANLAVLLSAVMIAAFSLVERSSSVPLSFLAFCALGVLVARKLDRTAIDIFLVSFGTGVIAAIVVYLYYVRTYGVPYLLGGSDDLIYETLAQQFERTHSLLDYGALHGPFLDVGFNSPAYVYIVAVLYRLGDLTGGVQTMIPRLFNVLCLAWIGVACYSMSLRLGLTKRTAVGAGIVAGVMPGMGYNAVMTYRDIPVALLLVWLVLLWLPQPGAERSWKVRPLLLSLLIIIALIDLRIAQAFVAAALVALALFLSTEALPRWGRVAWSLATVVVIAGIAALMWRVINTNILFFVGQIEGYNRYRAEMVSSGLSAKVFLTPPPLGWVLRVAYLIASPLPLPTTDIDLLWLRSGTIVQLLYVGFFFAGIKDSIRDRRRLLVLAAAAMLFSGVAFFTFEGRQIAQYLPFCIVVAAIGYEPRRGERWWYLLGTTAVLCLLAGAYYVLKG